MNKSVHFWVLNFRLGGQVSGIVAMQNLLLERDIDSTFICPAGIAADDKQSMNRFMKTDFSQQMFLNVSALLNRLKNDKPDDIYHLVLPSPAMAWIPHLLPVPNDRLILHYEGPSLEPKDTSQEKRHLSSAFILVRLILNGRWLAGIKAPRESTQIAVNNFMFQHLSGLGYEKIARIENITDIRANQSPPVDFEFPKDKIIVAYAGHAHTIKGIFVLLDAFARAVVENPKLYLVLALSSDGDVEGVSQRIEELGIQSHVQRLGVVPIQHFLDQIDVLILPYLSGLSTTIYPSLLLEANAMECKVITTEIPQWCEFFRSSPSLKVIPPSDTSTLCKELIEIETFCTSGWSPFLSSKSGSSVVDDYVQLLEAF